MINKKIIFAVISLSVISGCSSSFTSISPAEENDKYYVTEVHEIPFGITSELHLCEAQGQEKMVCTEINE